jgi:hypothetical protein
MIGFMIGKNFLKECKKDFALALDAVIWQGVLLVSSFFHR